MPMWRCPHCHTPQAEAARCWVCRRSSTTCSTCRHFRQAVAAQIGFCGLDKKRLPLRGTEMRGCWEVGAEQPLETGVAARVEADPRDERRARLDFVPVEVVRLRDTAAPPKHAIRLRSPDAPIGVRFGRDTVERGPSAAVPLPTPDSSDVWRDRVSLFGDEI